MTISTPIGSTATYTPPPPPGIGTIAGLASVFFQILASNANGGSWSNIVRNAAANPGGIPGGGDWTLGCPGTALPDGTIDYCQAGQFLLPGSTAQSNNPISNLWRGTWTPASYSARTVQFVSSTGGLHQGQNILIQYGIDANGDPLYVSKKVSQSHAPPISIPVVPAPAALMVIAASILLRFRRRR